MKKNIKKRTVNKRSKFKSIRNYSRPQIATTKMKLILTITINKDDNDTVIKLIEKKMKNGTQNKRSKLKSRQNNIETEIASTKIQLSPTIGDNNNNTVMKGV